ncbi:hypothetical protein [Ohtaekwangia koreensis]|jgi:hypothetical protein|uniref:Uncharacterized protein n=1 Tax=Ohtaekwangia koreensis TaxID=688867 RepID=A0A1T5M1W2_9BACT|nr:hypothetical protein [Ohtaekwangia koreensis]SKC82242.1 hypothetical protein SAMN05660236_4121 [Ohtaekwangia koreensis]
MASVENLGFDLKVIEDYQARMAALGRNYLFDDEDENSDEYAHFYFVGKFEGKDVIYDTVIYTLRLQHESELYEIAEHRAAKHFPEYKKITYEEDENGNLENLDPLEEEIGLFMAEVIMELEEDETVKVKEHVDLDDNAEFGVSLDVGLHVEHITDKVIEKFIKDFNEDTLKLDPTLYSFQTEDQEAG